MFNVIVMESATKESINSSHDTLFAACVYISTASDMIGIDSAYINGINAPWAIVSAVIEIENNTALSTEAIDINITN